MHELMNEIRDLANQERGEQRAYDPSWAALSLNQGGHTSYTTPHMAENLSTVLACVSAISTSIAGLPFNIYRVSDDGRVKQPSHPLAKLTRQGANQWQTFNDFIEFSIAECLLHGNSVSEIVTGQDGAVKALNPIPWQNVNIQMLGNGRLIYDVTEIAGVYGGSGRTRRLLQSEVLHLRDRTDDGLIGRSRLSRSGLAVSSALSTQNFASSMYANQATPSGIVTMKKRMSEAGLNELQREFSTLHTGSGNARKIVFLDNEMTFQPLSISPEDAELLSSRRFSVEEIARIYGVPPTIIGDLTNSSFTNAETLLRYFSQFTLRHWVQKLEAEISRSVFTSYERDRLQVEFDMSAFLRGDPDSRWSAHKIAVDADILTRNEIREIEGFNPLPE